MAAATVTGRQQNQVFGAMRAIAATAIAFANNGDTWVVPGIKRVSQINLTPTTNVAYGFTVSGATITLVAASGLTFRGAIIGL